MNRPPEILLNSGFVTDQNGILTEIVMPTSATTLNIPNKITFSGTTLTAIPYTGYKELYMPNIEQIPNENTWKNNTTLVTFSAAKLKSITISGNYVDNGQFVGATQLATISLPGLEELNNSQPRNGIFKGCVAITSVTFPKLRTVNDGSGNDSSGGLFSGCTSLTTVVFPLLEQVTGNAGIFYQCTALTSVTFGSEGHPVTSLSNKTFSGLSQSTLTITIYTADGLPLSGEPWGSTGASFEYEEA